jgi:hypothetical protein
MVRCESIGDTEGGWETPDASWLDEEEADGDKVCFLNIVSAGEVAEDGMPKCLTNKEEFQAWTERKELERKENIAAGERGHVRGRGRGRNSIEERKRLPSEKGEKMKLPIGKQRLPGIEEEEWS